MKWNVNDRSCLCLKVFRRAEALSPRSYITPPWGHRLFLGTEKSQTHSATRTTHSTSVSHSLSECVKRSNIIFLFFLTALWHLLLTWCEKSHVTALSRCFQHLRLHFSASCDSESTFSGSFMSKNSLFHPPLILRHVCLNQRTTLRLWCWLTLLENWRNFFGMQTNE